MAATDNAPASGVRQGTDAEGRPQPAELDLEAAAGGNHPNSPTAAPSSGGAPASWELLEASQCLKLKVSPEEVQPSTAAPSEEPVAAPSSSTLSEEKESVPPAELDLIYNGTPSDFRSLLPPLAWVPSYLRALRGQQTADDEEVQGTQPYSLKSDLIAGLTVGLMLVPQCLAYALLMGLPVRAGLYSSFAPLLVYALTGTIRQLQVGPTALMSLLTSQALDAAGWTSETERLAGASLLALLIGSFSALLGAVRFGFIVDLMSHSVVASFCTAAGITIATSQMPDLLGMDVPRYTFWWQKVWYIVTHPSECDGPTVILGVSLVAFLVFSKRWSKAGDKEARSKHLLWRFFPKEAGSLPFRAAKLVADMSSLISVAVGLAWGHCYRAAGVVSVEVIGKAGAEGFVFLAPGGALAGNVPWLGLIISALVMTVVGFLETAAVGGKCATERKYRWEANQELTALGLANVSSSVMSGFPVTGSFSRTAVNAMVGATSQLSGALASLLVVLAMYLLMPVVEELPKAALAPLLITGALGVTDVLAFVRAWKAGKPEFAIMVACFVTSMALSVKEGLGMGFVLSILKTMYEAAVPNITVCGQMPDGSFKDVRLYPGAKMPSQTVVVRTDAAMIFANVARVNDFALRAVQVVSARFLILDCGAVGGVDIAGAEFLVELAHQLSKRQRSLIVGNLQAPALQALHCAGAPEDIRSAGGHLCVSMEDALLIARGGDPAGPANAVDDLLARVTPSPSRPTLASPDPEQRKDDAHRWASPRSSMVTTD